MFGFFGKKRPKSAIDQFIVEIYGDPPPPKRANLESAVNATTNELLGGCIPIEVVRRKAVELNASPIPYSTHDLALSVALAFFKDPSFSPVLLNVQLLARMKSVEWLQCGYVVPFLASSFEDALYERYK